LSRSVWGVGGFVKCQLSTRLVSNTSGAKRQGKVYSGPEINHFGAGTCGSPYGWRFYTRWLWHTILIGFPHEGWIRPHPRFRYRNLQLLAYCMRWTSHILSSSGIIYKTYYLYVCLHIFKETLSIWKLQKKSFLRVKIAMRLQSFLITLVITKKLVKENFNYIVTYKNKLFST
jgi:hypothetical protein